VSAIYPEAGKSSFAGMVNDKLFNGGKNDLAPYEIVGGALPPAAAITIRRGRATERLGCHAGIGLGCSLMRSLGDFVTVEAPIEQETRLPRSSGVCIAE
jgi:hypothetical protein